MPVLALQIRQIAVVPPGIRALFLILLLITVSPLAAAPWSLSYFAGSTADCRDVASVMRADAGQWQGSVDAARAVRPVDAPINHLWIELRRLPGVAASDRPRVREVLVARGPRMASWHPWWVDAHGPIPALDTWTAAMGAAETRAPGFAALTLPDAWPVPADLGEGQPVELLGSVRLLACLETGTRPLRGLSRVEILDAPTLRELERRQELSLAVALGAMLAMGVLGLAFFWRLREPAYGYYAAYVVAFMGYLVYVLGGLAHWLPAGWRTEPVILALGAALVGLTGWLGMAFALAFTRLAQGFPRLARMAWQLTLLMGLGCVLAITAHALALPWLRSLGNSLINLPMVAAILLVLPAFVLQALRGSLEARYFVVGWSPLLGTVVWLAIESLTGGFSLVTLDVLIIGAASSSIVLGLGLADVSSRLRQERDRAIYAATHDGLTGAHNRAAFLRQLALQIDSGGAIDTRRSAPAALIYCDLDHFKQINDRHGHAAGDAVLCAFVERVQQLLRSRDLLGRLGGEEFAILLPQTEPGEAEDIAERLRAALAGTPIPAGSQSIPVTASFGLAMKQSGEAVDAWLARADQALYQAKHGGRNRVMRAA